MAKDIVVNELERCRPWIEAALEYSGGTHSFEDIALGIKEARMQLWPSPRGCIVTEIVVYPRKKVLNLFLAGGELDQLLDMNSDMNAWAKQQGCTGGTLTGRIGWKKILEPMGWKLIHSYYGKEVE